MRDPKRIPNVLSVIRKFWEDHPDMRLGQIIVNMTEPGKDPFYLEDEDLVRRLNCGGGHNDDFVFEGDDHECIDYS